jgi:hypothetical protein
MNAIEQSKFCLIAACKLFDLLLAAKGEPQRVVVSVQSSVMSDEFTFSDDVSRARARQPLVPPISDVIFVNDCVERVSLSLDPVSSFTPIDADVVSGCL